MPYRFILIFLFLSTSFDVFSQRAILVDNCAAAIKLSSAQESLKLCSESLREAERAGNRDSVAWLNLHLVDVYMAMAEHEKIDIHLKLANQSQVFENSPDFRYQWLRRSATKYYLLEDMFTAGQYFKRALDVAEKQNNKLWLAKSYNDMALIKQYEANYTESLSLYQRSLEYKESIGDSYPVAITLNNLGLINKELGDYPTSIYYYERALAKYQEYIMIKDHDQRAEKQLIHLYSDLAAIYTLTKSVEQSRFYANKVIETINQNENSHAIMLALTDLSNIHIQTGDYNQANIFAQQALKLSKKDGVVHTPLLLNLASIALHNQDYSKANSYANQALSEAQSRNEAKTTDSAKRLMIKIATQQQDYPQLILLQDSLLSSNEAFLKKKYDTDIKAIKVNIHKEVLERELLQEKLDNERQSAKLKNLNNSLYVMASLSFGLLSLLALLFVRKRAEKEKLTIEINYHKEQLKMLNKIEPALNVLENNDFPLRNNVDLIDQDQENSRLQLVKTMQFCLHCWKKTTGKNKNDLADESKIWKVSIDDGRLRTRSLDKYLNHKTLPQKPREHNVIRTCHYILSECNLSTKERQQLNSCLDSIT